MSRSIRIFSLLFFLFLGVIDLKSQSVNYSYGEIEKSILSGVWKYHDGDQATWSSIQLDDSKWDTLQTELKITKTPKEKFSGNAWFRIHLKLDSNAFSKGAWSLLMDQTGASEIFLDGIKIGTIGKIGTDSENEIRADAGGIPIALNLIPEHEHILAIRYSNHEADFGYTDDGMKQAGFNATLVNSNPYLLQFLDSRDQSFMVAMTLFGFFIALGIAHLLIFLFYPSHKSNLYYFVFIAFLSFFPLGIVLQNHIQNIHQNALLQLLTILDVPLFFTSFLAFLYAIFYDKFQKQLWIFIGVAIIAVAGLFINVFLAVILIVLVVVGTSVEAIRVIIVANRKNKNGARILGIGGLFLALFVISVIVLTIVGGGLKLSANESQLFMVLLLFSIIALPLCMSIHLAREFAQTNRLLKKRLKQVEILSERSIEQEKEKQRLLESEKDRLEIQVHERTSEISEQKKIIEVKNKELLDSIQYAKKLQEALFPTEKYIEKNMNRLKKDGENS